MLQSCEPLNGAGTAPPAQPVMLDRPVFVIVTTCWGATEAWLSGPKSREREFRLMEGATPVPFIEMLKLPKLSLELEVALKVPAAVGLKVK